MPGRKNKNRRRVLIIDDNRSVAHSLATLIRALGHESMYVDDPVKALDAARAFLPDIAFVALAMPTMDGYTLGRVLKAHKELKGLYLVALMGLGRPERPERYLEAGFDLQVRKPVDADAVKEIFAQLAKR